MPALGLWLLRNWKLMLAVLAVVGVLGLFGILRLELAAARLKADQAATKTTQQTLRAEAAEAEVARQKGFVRELGAVNQRNAALMADYQKRLAMQQEAADKATQSLANLKRSYAVAIEEIRNAKQ